MTIAGLPAQTARPELQEKGLRKPSSAGFLNKKRARFLFHNSPCLHDKSVAILVQHGNCGLSVCPPSNDVSDKEARITNLWEELFSDPSQWWDNRSTKTNNRHPDFKHKVTLEALWIDGWLNPPWVKEKFATTDFDSIQISGRTISRVPSSFSNYDEVQKLTYSGRLREALHLLELRFQKISEAPQELFVCLLRACIRRKALAEGKQVHFLIGEMKSDTSVILSNLLIGMYSACGSVADALNVFMAMPDHNVVTWTAMISAYAKSRQYKEAITLFQQMHQAGIEPDEIACIVALKACANIADLQQGKNLHSLVLKKGFESDVSVQNALVNMYMKCGCLKDARELFSNMAERDVVSWTAMIAGYTQGGLGMEALDLYKQMKQENMEPDKITLVLLLRACANVSALQQGKHFHSLILEKGLETQVIIQNALVEMYSKCGCLKDAREVFDNMVKRDMLSWSAMIAGYTHEGLGKEALDLYEQMNREGMYPDSIILVLLLKACASISALQQGKQFHSLILEKCLEPQPNILTALVDMYSKCGCLKDARKLFDKVHHRNVSLWNAMITGYTRKGLGQEALNLYEQMKHENMEPDNITLVLLLKACASVSALQQGKQFHSLILEKGLGSQLIIQNTLIDMYSKCGCLKDAREVFDNMARRDVVAWTAMIAGYAQEGLGKEALYLYEQMKLEGTEPDDITLVLLLKACASISALQQGKQFHSLILEKGLESEPIIQTALLDMYSKCGYLKEAHKVFNKMSQRNVISWNAMIGGYAQKGFGKEALDLYDQMKLEDMEPNEITLVLLLKASASISALHQGKQFHTLILEKGLESQLIIQNTLVDMYSKCGCLKDARETFDGMAEKDVVSWTAMISGYAQGGLGKDALELYEQMKREGMEPDNITLVFLLKACASISALEQGKQFHSLILEKRLESQLIIQNSLVDMYSKCGCFKDAYELFDNMPERDVVSWTSMIAGYVRGGLEKEALDLYERMKWEGMEPKNMTLVLLLKACASISALEQGKQFHSLILEKGLESQLILQTALVDMYSKCGCLKDARRLFDSMNQRDVVSWNAMIGGYAQEGLGKEALDLFQQMNDGGLQATDATYTSVLSACRHSGLVDKGCHIFESMSKDYGLTPTLDHYACMVDLLGRSGRLSDAEGVILKMPILPGQTVWMSLLGAARKYYNIDIGRHAFEHCVKLEPENAAPYLLLIEIYLAAGRMDEVAKLRQEMDDKDLEKSLELDWSQ